MKEYKEEDFIALSGIQHFSFCRRQWALIHIEQQWVDNVLTVKGNQMHKKAHNVFESEKRNNVVISRGMPVHSRELGISGICDIVEFQKSDGGIYIDKLEGNYTVFPVEYKRGVPKQYDADIMQVVAQAMCLEEMLCADIPKCALYYGETRHRQEIIITQETRNKVRTICEEMHMYIKKGYTPKCKVTTRCTGCSLREICNPEFFEKVNVAKYINSILSEDK